MFFFFYTAVEADFCFVFREMEIATKLNKLGSPESPLLCVFQEVEG